jgi:four helix bundle protein
MKSVGFTQLVARQKARRLALDVYAFTRTLPAEERCVLLPQMRRAAVSIPGNIAEGFGRRRPLDTSRFYTIAFASNEELKSYLLLTCDLGHLPASGPLVERCIEVSRLVRGLEESSLRSAAPEAWRPPSCRLPPLLLPWAAPGSARISRPRSAPLLPASS